MFLIVYPQALVTFSFFPHLIIFSYLHLKNITAMSSKATMAVQLRFQGIKIKQTKYFFVIFVILV
jgi:hypothetical protein